MHCLLAAASTFIVLVMRSFWTKILMRLFTVGRAAAVKVYRCRERFHVRVLNVAPLVEECVSTACLIRRYLVRSHGGTLRHPEWWYETTLRLTLIAIVRRSISKHRRGAASDIRIAANWNTAKHVTCDVYWSLSLVRITLTNLWLVSVHLSATLHANVKSINTTRDCVSVDVRRLFLIHLRIFVHDLTYKLILKFISLALVDFDLLRVLDLLVCRQRQFAFRLLLNQFLSSMNAR